MTKRYGTPLYDKVRDLWSELLNTDYVNQYKGHPTSLEIILKTVLPRGFLVIKLEFMGFPIK